MSNLNTTQTKPYNASQFISSQRHEWNDAANGWRKWWRYIDKGFQHANDNLIRLARIQPGFHVLDIATGAGEPAITAARRVGDNEYVIGTDFSTGMLSIARERFENLGITNIEFKEMEAGSLGFSDSTFDAVLCRSSLMLFPDLQKVFSSIRRVLKEGNWFSTMVPSVPPKVPMIAASMGVIQKELQPPPPPEGKPHFFSLSVPGALEKLFIESGFNEIESEKVSWVTEYESPESYVDFIRDIAPQVTRLIAGQSAESQNELWELIKEAVKQYVNDSGRISMINEGMRIAGRN